MTIWDQILEALRSQMPEEDFRRWFGATAYASDSGDQITVWVLSESILVIVGAAGRTTRLSPDGKKVKDDNTKVERKTRWDGAKLISEISGLGSGKITQTFAVAPESHQLRVTVQMEGGGRSGQARTITHVYDADAR